MTYRPWGPVEWALSLGSPKQWHFIGVIGTEVRSLTSWEYLNQLGIISSEQFAEIRDVESIKYGKRTRSAIKERRNRFIQNGGSNESIQQLEILAELFRINSFAQSAEFASTSIILDITSFPKRFFFPILRMLTRKDSNVRNLLLTYTSPASYAPDDEPLYEDPEPWRYLPGFGGTGICGEQWVVSVGFLVESLRFHVGNYHDERMKLLIPFPAPLSALRRTWASVANLEGDQQDGRFDKFRVDPLDISAAFDRIKQLAGNPERPLAFAPFGPKPTSAAMCLYALQRNSAVHYPQPTVYHPEYSIGVRDDNPATAVTAYWIRLEGNDLYTV